MRDIRILVITWACDAEDVSEAQVAATWVSELAQLHDIDLFAVSRPDRYGCATEQFPDISVTEWRDIEVPTSLERFRSVVNPGYELYYPRARRFLQERVKEGEYDLIHHLSPFAWRFPSPAAGLSVPLIRGPVAGGLATPPGLRKAVPAGSSFMALRELDRFRGKVDVRLRNSYRDSSHVLMAAPYVQDVLRGIDLPAVTIEPEIGLKEDYIPPAREGTGHSATLELLYVGRIIPSKGLRLAVAALAHMRRTDVRLTVVGDGDDRAYCEGLAVRLGVANQVRFVGWQDRAQVDRHYVESDVFVFPSVREPSGSVVLEAMAHSLPVIVANNGGPGYHVDDSCGFRVPVSSVRECVQGISAAVQQLANDRGLGLRLGRAGRERALGPLGWGAKRMRMADLYQSVAGASGS